MWIASNFFFDSDEALSRTESQYSERGRINEVYILSSALRLILNFKGLRRFNLAQAFIDISFMCSDHACLLENNAKMFMTLLFSNYGPIHEKVRVMYRDKFSR